MRRLLLLLACVAFSAHAVYPEKPIRFIIPSAPGGS
ncbi:MAG: tripartite tricarboxylate transporter substrate binding protein, partial [Betaproteobacteria bacterium]